MMSITGSKISRCKTAVVYSQNDLFIFVQMEEHGVFLIHKCFIGSVMPLCDTVSFFFGEYMYTKTYNNKKFLENL
jgi:hypothetical protein